MTPSGPPAVGWMLEWAKLPVFALMVLILLSMLGALVMPGTLGISRCDFSRKAPNDIRTLDSALREYASAHGGKYPETLKALVTPDVDGRTFFEGNHIPKDIWGHDYAYEPPDADHLQPRVICYGKDGQPGGVADDADVDNLSLRAER